MINNKSDLKTQSFKKAYGGSMTQATSPSYTKYDSYDTQPSKTASFCHLSAKGIKTALLVSVAALGVIVTYGAVIAGIGVALFYAAKAELASSLARDFMITTITGAGVATIATFKNPLELFKYYYNGLNSLGSSQKSPVSSTPPASETSALKPSGLAKESSNINIQISLDSLRTRKNPKFAKFAPAFGVSANYGYEMSKRKFKVKTAGI